MGDETGRRCKGMVKLRYGLRGSHVDKAFPQKLTSFPWPLDRRAVPAGVEMKRASPGGGVTASTAGDAFFSGGCGFRQDTPGSGPPGSGIRGGT